MYNFIESTSSAIQNRYAKEAGKNSYLSCGGALDKADVRSSEILADLGCGRGKEAIRAAGWANFVYGVDFTPEMIETAKKNASEKNIENIDFLKGSIEKIPLSDNYIDIVISNCTINHAENKHKVYSEIFRILKPGGRFVISDIIADQKIPSGIANDPRAIADCYGGAILAEDYFTAIKKAGFKKIEKLEESQPYEKNGVWLRSLTLRSYKLKNKG